MEREVKGNHVINVRNLKQNKRNPPSENLKSVGGFFCFLEKMKKNVYNLTIINMFEEGDERNEQF